MLKKIAASNFKAFGASPPLDLSLSGFNLFLGENNSGKTSAADVVALFVQTARASTSSIGLAWSGDLIDFGPTGEYAVHNAVRSTMLTIAVEIQTPPELSELSARLSPRNQTEQSIGYRLSFQPTKNRYRYEFLLNGHVLVRNQLTDLPTGGNRAELEIRDFPAQKLGMDYVPASQWQTNVFNPNLFSSSNLLPPSAAMAMASLSAACEGIPTIRDVLSSKVFLLGANRGIHKVNLADDFKIPDVGRNGQHTLQVLSAVLARPEFRGAASKIREWAGVFGLSDVSSGWAGGSDLHSGYVDPLISAELPLRSAGFGSQQILPIIVQLFASPADSVVIIEEPEISLHPAAQVQLVRMFTEAVRTGRQVIITTHSQYLAMALQEEVNQGIQPTDISVYHFSRTQNGSAAKELEVDSEGILRGWIPSFAEVEQRLLSSWMARVHDKLKND
jgi:hypothetical protein